MLLYIHVPFCDSKCFYCSFNSYVDKLYLKERYTDALLEQFVFDKDRFGLEKKGVETLFIGGGTPSTLPIKLYEKIFKKISPFFDGGIEITIEANPNSATKEWLEGVKNLGVNRVSFGVQSFDEKKLRYLGRNHSSKMAIDAVESAYKIGFKNISIDLIHDCVIEDKNMLKSDLYIASKLPINHISSYSLTIEKGTKFYKIRERSKENEEEQKWFYKQIISLGFPRYEVSNFGRYKCKHNLGYWEHKDYIGLGSGAVGFLKNRRFYPEKNVEKYIQNPTYFKSEELSKEELKEEKLFLGLRSIVGFEQSILNSKEIKKLDILIDEKIVIKKDGRVFNRNFMISDEIALFILN